MKNFYIIQIFKSYYCISIFVVILFIGYFLLPKQIFIGWYNVLAYIFLFLFSVTFTCLIRTIKDRMILNKKNKKNLFTALFGLIGLSAFQVCGIGAPVCGATIGGAIVSAIFPSVFFRILSGYAIYFIYISIIVQLLSLIQMKCFVSIIKDRKCS